MSTPSPNPKPRRKMIFVASLMSSLVLVFWINDVYAIWQVLNNPQLCADAACQKAISKIFWTDVVQIVGYTIMSIWAIFVILRNYDVRSQQIQKQTEAQKAVQDLYDNAPCGYHSLDENGIYIHINQTELNWLGYTREEIIGKMKLADLQATFSSEQFSADYKSNLHSDGVKDLELNLRRKDGSLFPVLLNVSMIRDEQGNFKNTRTTLLDYSKKRKLLNELEEARTIAEKSVETKERFMANMSHEIRTPMNALIGFTNLLARTPLDTKQEEFVTTIKTAGENLLTLINDLLDFSKMEAGMLRIETTPFDLEGVIHSVAILFKPKADEKRLNFEVKVAPHIPQNLIGDPMRVSQIVVNLLGNAFKFTERGYVALTAELFDNNTDFATVKITIKDTGIGFHNEELPRIFQRFQQAKDDTTRLYGGSGLGLAIVKNLAEAMGGFVEADSKVGFGSTFSVILPFKKGKKEHQISEVIARKEATKFQNNAPLQTSNVKLQTLQPHQTSNIKLQTPHPRILVVEDNPMNQRLAALLLSDWGYEYDIVQDGQRAIDILQTVDFQLILMDIQLPVMDGYTATTIIRNELKSTIPIIATTAHAFSNEREKCFAVGMNDYVPKPLQEDEVLKVIKKYLHKTE